MPLSASSLGKALTLHWHLVCAQQGVAVMHSSSEQVMRPRVSGDEPAESYAVESGARLPPLEPGLYSVRISVHDAFPGAIFERAPGTDLQAHVAVVH